MENPPRTVENQRVRQSKRKMKELSSICCWNFFSEQIVFLPLDFSKRQCIGVKK
jgi:hypothetical protein